MKIKCLGFLVALSAGFSSFGFACASNADEGRVIAGPSDAKVTIEEYVDFECIYCAKGTQVVSEILRNYKGQVKLVLRNLPLPMHKHALPAAKAFVAVWLQDSGLAYAFQEQLFNNQARLSEGESYLMEVAAQLGLNTVQMKNDMDGDQVANILAEDAALAQKHGFRGTPSFIIGSEKIEGTRDYDEFRSIVERQLAK